MRPTQNKKETAGFLLLFVFSAAAVLYAAGGFSKTGFFREQLFNPRTEVMVFELILLFLWLVDISAFVKDRRLRDFGLLLGVCVFLWMHRILLPILVSGVYCSFLLLFGELVLLPLRRKEGSRASAPLTRLSHDFLTGSASYMLVLCLLSAFGIGNLFAIRCATGCLFLILLLLFAFFERSRIMPIPYENVPPEPQRLKAAENKTGRILMLSLTAVMLLLQAGRINIALDYDSLHYGLRSQFILNNGRGIYENLGLVNDVYFYPKGFELLTMPLSGTCTYGFVLSFSWWCAVFMLVTAGAAVQKIAGKKAGLCAALLISLIPGVMNLACSAKTDMGTLLFQVIFLNDVILHLRDTEDYSHGRHLLWAAAAILLSFTMKPTALVFSSLLFFTTLLFLAFQKKLRIGKQTGAGQILALPVLALFAVTLRTVLLTGYPFSSVFTSIWETAGLHCRYPLSAHALPNAGEGLSAADGLNQWLSRLGGFFFYPAGQDNRHILISWGTVLFPALLLGVFAGPLFTRKGQADKAEKNRTGKPEKKDPEGCLAGFGFFKTVLLVFLAADFLVLFLLWQVDGNYFMLTYVLAAMAAAVRYGTGEKRLLSFLLSVLPAILFAVVMTCTTSWAGSRGLTPVAFNHYGFYDHEGECRDRLDEKGCKDIYEYLQARKRTRVLAFADEPACYGLPCCTESYTDVEGSGGNVRLVKTLNAFKDYLDYAGIDNFYTEESFLSGHSRAADIIRFMKEDGSLREIMQHEGRTLYEYKTGIRN